MAKLMVCIDFPDMSYEEMKKRIKPENRQAEFTDGFFSEVDGSKVVIDFGDLEQSEWAPDTCYVFELIGCKP